MTAGRDEAIDRLLHETRSAGTPSGECPDAETLAAFAEGTLRAPARREVETHIADCHRCQMVTASMVNVESTLGAWPDETPAEKSWWKTKAAGWMVPAAVGVTAGALWLAIVEPRRPSSAPVPDSQSEPASEFAVIAPEPDSVPKLQDATGNARTGSTAELRAERAATPAAPPAPQRAAAAAKAEESLAASAPPPASAQPRALEERAESRGLARSSEADRPPAPAAPEKPAATTPLGGVASARAITAQRRDASSLDIVSPDPQVRWRIVGSAAVQRSNDAGASWATQQTGVTTDLTAGSAPAADVCWLVGRGGVVVRTTNGGGSWQRLTFPVSSDLTAVTASSRSDATATLADGRRFRTMDGGATWAEVR